MTYHLLTVPIIALPIILVLCVTVPIIWAMVWLTKDPMQASAVALALEIRKEELVKEKVEEDDMENNRCADIVREAIK